VIIVENPHTALAAVINNTFAAAGVFAVHDGVSVLPISGWTAPHRGLPLLLDAAKRLHDEVVGAPFPYRVTDSVEVSSTPVTTVQIAVALRSVIVVITELLLEARRADAIQEGVLVVRRRAVT
jgi:hypothetical protein